MEPVSLRKVLISVVVLASGLVSQARVFNPSAAGSALGERSNPPPQVHEAAGIRNDTYPPAGSDYKRPKVGMKPLDHIIYSGCMAANAPSRHPRRDGGQGNAAAAANQTAVGMRVPTCIRKAGKLHTQRKWSISYDWDNKYNGMHCGLSLREAMKDFKLCRPLTDWTCVESGVQGYGGVTIEFHTPRTCDDKRINEAVKKATAGQLNVWCKHH